MIEVEKFFRMVKHPLGDGIYTKFKVEFKDEEHANRFKNTELNWEEGVIAEEITEQEYNDNTDEECEDDK